MSSYGQHAPSSSFQQDSALVAQFVSHDLPERDPRALAPSDIPEEVAFWNDSIPHEPRPKRLTIGPPIHKPEAHTSTNESSPLLRKPSISRITETYEGGDGGSDHNFDYRRTFFEEVKTLARYTLPVFGCASLFLFRADRSHSAPYLFCRTHVLEVRLIIYRSRCVCSNNHRQYSLLVAGTISIGHLSTKALAAATLASMTASVTGFSIMQGFLSSLDTLLPSAWTSSNPQLVGLWCQRVCKYPSSRSLYSISN